MVRHRWLWFEEKKRQYSYKEHVVDALAVRGDEGRRSLRKAPVSWQASDDPEMSEWGNPAHIVRHP